MRSLAYILLAGVLLSACYVRKDPPIPEEKFIDLLIELSTSEAIYSKIYDTDSTAVRTIAIRNKQLLDRYKVTKEQFEETYHFYDDNKEELLRIYTAAIDSANARRERYQSIKK